MARSVRLLSFNIQRGGVGREAAIAQVLAREQPDIVVLQEAVRPTVVATLGRLGGYDVWAGREGLSLGFLSRIPIQGWTWHASWLVRRPFLEIQLAESDTRIFGVHLSAIHSNWTEARRLLELRTLLGRVPLSAPSFHVVVGDFNTLAPGEALPMSRLPARLRALLWLGGGRIRWRTIREMLRAGYADAYRTLHASAPGYTFPASDPHIRLDYLFVPVDSMSRVASCEVVSGTDADLASDHLPLAATVMA